MYMPSFLLESHFFDRISFARPNKSMAHQRDRGLAVYDIATGTCDQENSLGRNMRPEGEHNKTN